MNWQIDRAVDHFIEHAEAVTAPPEFLAAIEVRKKRIEELRKKEYESEFDVLYDLASVHVISMLSGESGWSLSKDNFRLISIKMSNTN